MSETASDARFLRAAIRLALEAEAEGNLPIGCVVTLGGRIVAEGRSRIWEPVFDATRHAEIEALRALPRKLLARAPELSLFTTLEPCMMCAGAIYLHRIGRLVFGAKDDYGGLPVHDMELPAYFEKRRGQRRWEGPALSEECDRLFVRALELVASR